MSGLASSELGRLEWSMVEMEMEPPRPMNGSERASLAFRGRGGWCAVSYPVIPLMVQKSGEKTS